MPINPYNAKDDRRLVVTRPVKGLKVDQVVRFVGRIYKDAVVVDRKGLPHVVSGKVLRNLYPSQAAGWGARLA
jgi:hypothetical protein